MKNSNEYALTTALPTGRRSFVGLLIGLIWTAITGSIGTIAALFVAAPTGAAPASNWVEIGTLRDIPEGKATKRAVVVKQDSGWVHFNSSRSVWIVRCDQQATVFSSACPHLGCTIDASADGFKCPCHGSAWNTKGEKLGGPTPRGLDVLESRIDGDKLKVRHHDFKQGSSQKELS